MDFGTSSGQPILISEEQPLLCNSVEQKGKKHIKNQEHSQSADATEAVCSFAKDIDVITSLCIFFFFFLCNFNIYFTALFQPHNITLVQIADIPSVIQGYT